MLGAHPIDSGGTVGTRFAVWAPNARRVSVVGDFNSWDGSAHIMNRLGIQEYGRYLYPVLRSLNCINMKLKTATVVPL